MEKSIVKGLPVVVPQGLTKEQEEQYLCKFVSLLPLPLVVGGTALTTVCLSVLFCCEFVDLKPVQLQITHYHSKSLCSLHIVTVQKQQQQQQQHSC